MSFYAVLPANNPDFPRNTNSDFRVRFARPLQMDGDDWEVGLVDMHYPATWKNIPVDAHLTVRYREHTRIAVVRHGRYTSIAQVLKEVESNLCEFKVEDKITVEYDEIENRVWFYNGFVPDTMSYIKFDETLADILGFRPNYRYGYAENAGYRAPNLNRGFYSLFVYCDLMQDTRVGNVMAPLLRTVSANRASTVRRHENAYDAFTRVYYHPVRTLKTDEVHVFIRDDTGAKIPFAGGNVSLTLHFRRKRR